jgi:predicted nucleic acid-binding protein
MVGIDTTFLSLMLYPKARPPQDPSTKKPVERMEDRIEKLLEDLDSESERIILATPVLSEFLILVGKDAPAYLEKLSGMKNIFIKPFDEVAAIDLAAMELQDRSRGNKRSGSGSPWAKLRFDRQIVAISRTNGAKRIYSDDEDVMKFATKLGIEVIRTWELPLPAAKQITMEYEQDGGKGSRGQL